MLGHEVLADAIRQLRPEHVVGVAGRPCTAAIENLVASGDARWVNHEAVALQIALGAAARGQRTVALMKQVGLNAAIDVLACAALHRSGGAVVIVSGDDPGATYSQVEGDSRAQAWATEVPCYDAAGGEDLPAALRDALELSEALRVPVLLRVTTQMMMERDIGSLPPVDPLRGKVPAYDPAPTWRTNGFGTRVRLHDDVARCEEPGAVLSHLADGAERLRIVASGEPARLALALDETAVLVIRRVVPFPREAVTDFLVGSEVPILVLEDGLPLLEREVQALVPEAAVLGRLSGHVASAGPLDAAATVKAVLDGGRAAPLEVPYADHDHIADPSPYGSLFDDAVALGFPPVAVDAGHAWGAGFRHDFRASLGYGLGSAIGVAAGVALSHGQAAIAATGDFSMYHANLLALLQVVRDRVPVITVVLDNGRADYTGGQPHLGSEPQGRERMISLERLAAGAGVDLIEVIDHGAPRSESLRPLLQRLAGAGEPSLIVIRDRSDEGS